MNYEDKVVFAVDKKSWDEVVIFCLQKNISLEQIDTAGEASGLASFLEQEEDWESSNQWKDSNC